MNPIDELLFKTVFMLTLEKNYFCSPVSSNFFMPILIFNFKAEFVIYIIMYKVSSVFRELSYDWSQNEKKNAYIYIYMRWSHNEKKNIHIYVCRIRPFIMYAHITSYMFIHYVYMYRSYFILFYFSTHAAATYLQNFICIIKFSESKNNK